MRAKPVTTVLQMAPMVGATARVRDTTRSVVTVSFLSVNDAILVRITERTAVTVQVVQMCRNLAASPVTDPVRSVAMVMWTFPNSAMARHSARQKPSVPLAQIVTCRVRLPQTVARVARVVARVQTRAVRAVHVWDCRVRARAVQVQDKRVRAIRIVV